MTTAKEYRGYLIDYDPPPIPVRDCDWQYAHKDFDGAPDGCDHRCGFAPTYQACVEAIDDLIEDEE